MKKRIWGVAILICLSTFIFLVVGCATTTHQERTGEILQINVIEKDFVTLGIIFVTSSITTDDYGNVIKGSKITFEMLMKEASLLGADDIFNLRIDQIENVSNMNNNRTITFNATALAIKYVKNE